jgi:alkylation response protein AidB-like acyl-CoA dehydrogenase
LFKTKHSLSSPTLPGPKTGLRALRDALHLKPKVKPMTTDYFKINDLLSPEHRLIQQSVREWVNRAVKPIIDQAAQDHHFPEHLTAQLGEIGAFGPFIPEEYGGAGLGGGLGQRRKSNR